MTGLLGFEGCHSNPDASSFTLTFLRASCVSELGFLFILALLFWATRVSENYERWLPN